MVSAVKTLPSLGLRREQWPSHCAPLGVGSLTSQVITSSDLLPPPPLTLAGVTSGTAGDKTQVTSGDEGQTRARELPG